MQESVVSTMCLSYINFDPKNKQHRYSYYNDPMYHALVYMAMVVVCRQPIGYLKSYGRPDHNDIIDRYCK